MLTKQTVAREEEEKAIDDLSWPAVASSHLLEA